MRFHSVSYTHLDVYKRQALGSVLEDEKKLGTAEEQFRSTLKIDPHFAPGAIKLSEVLIAEGQPQAAVACLEDAVKQAPPDQAEPRCV